jgi:pyruvate formate lyase activating enzyme
MPWHVTAFHGDYKMTEPENTTADMLLAAADIGREAGLHYIYAGNLPGQVGDLEDTHCIACGDVLVGRGGYHVRRYAITPDGCCASCGVAVPGRWSASFDGQLTTRPFLPGSRSQLRLLRL